MKMTTEEEHRYLDIAWEKIGNWVRKNCEFSNHKMFRFPHDTHRWWNLEVFPTGECIMMRGTHDSNCPEDLVFKTDSFTCESSLSEHTWFPTLDSIDKLIGFKGDDYFDRYGSRYRDNVKYSLLRKLVDNWDFVKNEIISEIIKDNDLVTFEV